MKIDRTSRPHQPRHVRLQFDNTRQKWVVLAPEKVLWPDDVSVDILRRCDGKRTIAEIAADLAAVYDAGRDEIETDVIAFLQDWRDRRLVEC